jgi:hypothetical protein
MKCYTEKQMNTVKEGRRKERKNGKKKEREREQTSQNKIFYLHPGNIQYN